MSSFDSLWNGQADFLVSEQQPAPVLCSYAEKFATWAQELCINATQTPSIVAINQAKVLLLDKYWEWYRAVPVRHRSSHGHSSRHTCIFGVFETAYNRLKLVELALTPPMLFLPEPLPPPPPSPPPPQIAGIFLGESEGA